VAITAALLVRFPETFFAIRGNHETPTLSECSGFKGECQARYGNEVGLEVYEEAIGFFQAMPLAVVLNKQLLCVHGGVGSGLTSLDQLEEFAASPEPSKTDSVFLHTLWADPSYEPDALEASNQARGASIKFGDAVLSRVLAKLELKILVRAHQMQPHGYEWFAGGQGLSLFSAPNYQGTKSNAGAMAVVSRSGMYF
jgi:diadenosine tetraphosphatase ApaH/serine/threonine PP2A family protein phosphatase